MQHQLRHALISRGVCATPGHQRPWPARIGQRKAKSAKACSHKLWCVRTCQVRCVQALNDTACCWADVTWLIGAGHDRCRPADALTPRLMCADLGRCRLSLVYACRPQMVSPNPCAHATADACRPWLMLHAISRRCLPDTHMPRPMRGFWLRGVGIVFPENHNKYVQPKYARSKVQTHINFHK